MKRSLFLFKLALVLALSFVAFLPKPAAAAQLCVIACHNLHSGQTCDRTYCSCDAEGGALTRCTVCSDNDYHCS